MSICNSNNIFIFSIIKYSVEPADYYCTECTSIIITKQIMKTEKQNQMKDSKSEKTTSTLKNTNNIYTKASLSARCSLILFEKWEEIVTSPVFLTRVQYTHWQHLAISERNRIKQVSKTGALRASRLCSYAHWSFIQCEGFCFFWSIPSQFILISQVNL